MNQKDLEQSLNIIVSEMVNSIQTQHMTPEVLEAVNVLKDSYMTKDADSASCCIFFPLKTAQETIAKMIIPNLEDYPKDKQWIIIYLWQEFGHVEHYLSNFISKFEGHTCCSDKARWLLERYMDFLLKGDVPDMTRDDHCYWKPKFGEAKDWIQFIEGYIESCSRYSVKFIRISEKLCHEGEQVLNES